jgi:nucleoside-diphosphate-sugar epimerase
MKVFVAGGSGAVGRRLVPALIAAGHDVVATTRSSQHAEALRSSGAEPAIVDGLDEQAMIQAVIKAEPEVVIHEMSALAGKMDLRRFDRWFAVTNELRTKGTDYLIRGAQRAGARRILAQSYTGWSNIRDGGSVKTEEDPLDPSPPAAMTQTLEAIRYLEREVTHPDGLEGLALRYGSLYGPGTSTSEEFPELLRKRRMPIIGDGGGVWSFVHVDDAAAATVCAIDRGAPGIYNIVDDDPAPASAWLPYAAEALGAKPPRRVPVWLGRLAAGDTVVSMMTRIRGSSNAKAKAELGWEPRHPSWREGFPDELAAAPASSADAPVGGTA